MTENATIIAERLAGVLANHPEAAEAMLEALRCEDGAREVLNLKCNLTATLRGADGQIKQVIERHNHSA